MNEKIFSICENSESICENNDIHQSDDIHQNYNPSTNTLDLSKYINDYIQIAESDANYWSDFYQEPNEYTVLIYEYISKLIDNIQHEVLSMRDSKNIKCVMITKNFVEYYVDTGCNHCVKPQYENLTCFLRDSNIDLMIIDDSDIKPVI